MDQRVANRRVRWTDEERAALVRRCQTLRVEYPAASIAELLDKSQQTFPLERRRPSNPALRAWLVGELQRAAPAPGEVKVWRPEPVAAASPEPQAAAELPPMDDAPAAAQAPTALPAAAPLVASLVEAGVQVLLGILADARIRSAVANLLSAPPATATAGAEDAMRRCVVIAGIPSAEVSAVEKALDGTLQLRFWSPDQSREQLQQLLPEARLVIGMPDGLSPALESSLRNLGARYVRHDSGMPGLYRRLASEALR
jgi:hypothetical protein